MKKRMAHIMKSNFYTLLITLFICAGAANMSFAQLTEPDVVEIPDPKTPLSEGYRNSISLDIMLNNFGFGIGGSYGRVVGPYTQITFQTGITGIRDVSEQTFQNFFTGRQIVPNKYKRAFGFPFLFGLKQRIFARQIDDNFRLFIAGSVGPAVTFVYPYVRDTDNSGFRTFNLDPRGFLFPIEGINDFFSGWREGDWKWGYNGELKIGIDFGSSFGTQTTVEFGYFFYYFDEGLQLMEPRRATAYNSQGRVSDTAPFYEAQKYFGTPVIRLSFGSMW